MNRDDLLLYAVTDRSWLNGRTLFEDVEKALKVGATMIQLREKELEQEAFIEEEKILGVTAKTIEQARAARDAGADYLGSGAIFGSKTKKDAKSMTEEILKSIVDSVEIPVVAIGGIDADNILKLKGLGLAGAAIVSGIFAQPDIEAASRRLKTLCKEIVTGN